MPQSIHTCDDARRLARRRLPWLVFDYIDGAAGVGYAEQLNRSTLQQMQLQPRILNDVEHRSLAVSVFGREAQLPIGISPMGMCNLSRPGADLMLARLAARHRLPIGASTAASTSLESIIEASEGNAWFQLYFSGQEADADRLMARAEAAGYETLILTVDVPEVGRRPRELRRGFTMPFRIGASQFIDFACHPQWSLSTLFQGAPALANFGGDFGEFDRTSSRAGADWGLLERIRDRWQGKLVVKGVLGVTDALSLKSAGVDAIQVSSHGGRQLDSAPPAIIALAEIRDAVGKEFPLFYDSGIRSGEDIVKAYASGADFVFLGRPWLFAIAAGGRQGLQQLLDVLASETSITLAQLGLRGLSEVDQTCLVNPAVPD
ncbi:MAG: alpha-hydroxy-acid oxidizing protein [Granulosicoccus sp.]|nr:alpha-hydroxy-acid oxidizing protein [Granulosicoccus sp.]